jgi:hypothetical protein
MSYQEIDPKDIRKGDHIRTEYGATNDGVLAVENVSIRDVWYQQGGETCFLMHRPVTLPTEPGIYIDSQEKIWRLWEDYWDCLDAYDCDVDPTYLPFHRLMTEIQWEATK